MSSGKYIKYFNGHISKGLRIKIDIQFKVQKYKKRFTARAAFSF